MRIAELLKARVVPVEFKSFPDGESYLRFLGDVEGDRVCIVQTACPPQDTNLLRALLMADTAVELGAEEVVLVVPYLAYARQDKRFLEGETVSLKTVLKLFRATAVKKLITVDAHNPKVLEEAGIEAQNLSAIPLLAEHLRKRGLRGALSLSLGKKALDMAVKGGEVLGGGHACLITRRDLLTGRVVVEGALEARARDVVIFDDIISTGGTMVEAVKAVVKQGARRVLAACVHPLLIRDAMEMILRSGAEQIVGTDTVPSPVSFVSVAPLIADALAQSG